MTGSLPNEHKIMFHMINTGPYSNEKLQKKKKNSKHLWKFKGEGKSDLLPPTQWPQWEDEWLILWACKRCEVPVFQNVMTSLACTMRMKQTSF